jgi:hypothetical protein
MSYYPILLASGVVGIAVSLVIIGGGLVWLLVRTIRAQEVDRRVIFLFIFVAVATPVIFPFTFEERLSPTVKAAFDQIENLPSGSRVLISYDFDPAGAPELQPHANSFVRHAFAKGHKIVFMGLWPQGQSLLNVTLQQVVIPEFPDKKSGVDYAVLGYKAGNEGVLNVIVTNLRKMFPTDVNSVPLEQIPIFDGVRSMRDFDLILPIGSGQPGVKEWVLFVGDPAQVPIAGGVAAVSTPQLFPYYPKQLKGLLGGVKGGAEYESELKRRYPRFSGTDTPAMRMMGPQTLAHLVIMAFIVLGNVAFFRRRARGESR